MKKIKIKIITATLTILTAQGAFAQEHVGSQIRQVCYTDQGASPHVTMFLKEHSNGESQYKTYSLLLNQFEEGQPEAHLTSGYRPVMIEENLIHNPLFEISATLEPVSKAGLKSRSILRGSFVDVNSGKTVQIEGEVECAIRHATSRDWIFSNGQSTIISVIEVSPKLVAERSCFIDGPGSVCRIDLDVMADVYVLNRPGQDVCGVQILSTNQTFVNDNQIEQIAEGLEIWTYDLRSNKINILPSTEVRSRLPFISSVVSEGFAGTYNIRPRNGKTLRQFFVDVLDLDTSDAVVLQGVLCH